ncbi:MAG: hypothetical protein ABII23_02625 [bacterium]
MNNRLFNNIISISMVVFLLGDCGASGFFLAPPGHKDSLTGQAVMEESFTQAQTEMEKEESDYFTGLRTELGTIKHFPMQIGRQTTKESILDVLIYNLCPNAADKQYKIFIILGRKKDMDKKKFVELCQTLRCTREIDNTEEYCIPDDVHRFELAEKAVRHAGDADKGRESERLIWNNLVTYEEMNKHRENLGRIYDMDKEYAGCVRLVKEQKYDQALTGFNKFRENYAKGIRAKDVKALVGKRLEQIEKEKKEHENKMREDLRNEVNELESGLKQAMSGLSLEPQEVDAFIECIRELEGRIPSHYHDLRGRLRSMMSRFPTVKGSRAASKKKNNEPDVTKEDLISWIRLFQRGIQLHQRLEEATAIDQLRIIIIEISDVFIQPIINDGRFTAYTNKKGRPGNLETMNKEIDVQVSLEINKSRNMARRITAVKEIYRAQNKWIEQELKFLKDELAKMIRDEIAFFKVLKEKYIKSRKKYEELLEINDPEKLLDFKDGEDDEGMPFETNIDKQRYSEYCKGRGVRYKKFNESLDRSLQNEPTKPAGESPQNNDMAVPKNIVIILLQWVTSEIEFLTAEIEDMSSKDYLDRIVNVSGNGGIDYPDDDAGAAPNNSDDRARAQGRSSLLAELRALDNLGEKDNASFLIRWGTLRKKLLKKKNEALREEARKRFNSLVRAGASFFQMEMSDLDVIQPDLTIKNEKELEGSEEYIDVKATIYHRYIWQLISVLEGRIDQAAAAEVLSSPLLGEFVESAGLVPGIKPPDKALSASH